MSAMMATAASGEPQKQLLSLIRDFATEKSHGDRRVSDLQKWLPELREEFGAANEELEAAKRLREAAEQELRGSQVQLSMADASIHALQGRMTQLHEEISQVGLDLAVLKSKGDTERNDFIGKMEEMNTKIRQFQQMAFQIVAEKQPNEVLSGEGGKVSGEQEVPKSKVLKGLEDKIEYANAQMHKLEETYQKELHDHQMVSQELADIKRKKILAEAVIEETKQLQELGQRTADLEKLHFSLGKELQLRYACPGCGFNNMADVEEAEH